MLPNREKKLVDFMTAENQVIVDPVPVEVKPVDTRNDGVAPIKPEFLVTNTSGAPKAVLSDIADVSEAAEAVDSRDKPRERGMNTKRKFDFRVSDSENLCQDIAVGKECSYVGECRRSHDLQAYLASREPGIDNEPCPLFEQYGLCKYGIKCRYFSQHTDAEHKQIRDEVKMEACPIPEINSMSRQVAIQVRKRKYEFPLSLQCMSDMKIQDHTSWNKNKVTESQPAKETASEIAKNEPRSKTKVDFKDKLYLAPLTTVGNLPFRVICKRMGADITCGEMAMSDQLMTGNVQEWALLRRHPSEDIFGMQICGNKPDLMMRAVELINNECNVDFIDLNLGCPIDMVYKQCCGSGLFNRARRLQDTVRGICAVSSVPVTVKCRAGLQNNVNIAHDYIPKFKEWGAQLCTVHGRSRQQRYTKLADWKYISQCADIAKSVEIPLFGNGDILGYTDYDMHMKEGSLDGCMIGRGALIKPWIFTEIKERRHYDISSSERMDILKSFCREGMMHWGSDSQGVSKTRRFLLEWLSFLCRYIPVGVLEQVPQRMNDRPPKYAGRDDMETLMASDNVNDWFKISEMLLGKAPESFTFLPKHKSNSY